jgi:hypothetical protein
MTHCLLETDKLRRLGTVRTVQRNDVRSTRPRLAAAALADNCRVSHKYNKFWTIQNPNMMKDKSFSTSSCDSLLFGAISDYHTVVDDHLNF